MNNSSFIYLLLTLSSAVCIFSKNKQREQMCKIGSGKILIKNVDVNVILPTSGCYCLRPPHVFVGAEEADRLLPRNAGNDSPLHVDHG